MRRAALVLVVLTVACHDFTLVEPPRGGPPGLLIFVQGSVEDSAKLDLAAELRGTGDAAGQPSALYVESTAVPPKARASGVWTYEWHEAVPAPSTRTDLRLTTPALAGLPSSALALTILIPRREDPVNVVSPFGEDVRLHVSPATPPASPLTDGGAQWVLELRQSDGSGQSRQLVVAGTGSYPPELRVPWAWINAAGLDSATARLQLNTTYHGKDTPYDVDVIGIFVLTWRIRVLPQATGQRAGRRDP